MIWMLNPYEINEKALGVRKIDELDSPPYEYSSTLGGKGVPHSSPPLALSVAWMNERIEREFGLFTVHGTDLSPLNEQRTLRSAIRHVVISNSLVLTLRKQLLDSDVTPDLPPIVVPQAC